jgi:hypothetical protein
VKYNCAFSYKLMSANQCTELNPYQVFQICHRYIFSCIVNYLNLSRVYILLYNLCILMQQFIAKLIYKFKYEHVTHFSCYHGYTFCWVINSLNFSADCKSRSLLCICMCKRNCNYLLNCMKSLSVTRC